MPLNVAKKYNVITLQNTHTGRGTLYGLHLQYTTPGWPQSLTTLPSGTPVKAVDGVQWLHEVKQHNPRLKTILRHWYDQGQVFDGSPYSVLLDRAAAFFATFVDGTFSQYAASVDYIETWNETLANSQSPDERKWRIDQERAMCEVWLRDYRHLYPHIKLVLANTAIGNDIPWEIASLCVRYGHVLGYHAYIGVHQGAISPADDRWLSGRWRFMDAEYRNIRNAQHPTGIRVSWLITEGGPCLDFSGTGSLDPISGWRHPQVCGGDLEKYKEFLGVWMTAAADWNRVYGGRMLGGVLFTTGQPGGVWESFNLNGSEWVSLANFIKNFTPGNPPPPPPPPTNPPAAPSVQTRVHLLRPKVLNSSQWQAVQMLMTEGIQPGLIGRTDANPIVFGYEGWSHVDAYLAIKQSLDAGKLDSRLLVMDGGAIGSGLTPQWVIINWPLIADKVYFINSDQL